MTEAVLVVFTACWIAHAVPVPTAGHCEALKPDLLRTLAVVDPSVTFTAACYPVETDLRALEHERLETLACIWPPVTDPRSAPGRARPGS